jgi:hypothetical protein
MVNRAGQTVAVKGQKLWLLGNLNALKRGGKKLEGWEKLGSVQIQVKLLHEL